MTETWKAVPGFVGRYEVSDHGRVRSLLWAPPRLMAMAVGKNGYPSVGLAPGSGESIRRTVHSLVTEAFIGPRPQGLVVRHLDGRHTNNHLSNLTYGTYSENAFDAVEHGTNSYTARTECPEGHPYDTQNTIVGRRANGRTFRQCRACHARDVDRYRQRRLAGVGTR